jgi:hypothetical protein
MMKQKRGNWLCWKQQKKEKTHSVCDYESMHHIYWGVWDIKNLKLLSLKGTFNDVLCRFEALHCRCHNTCMKIYNWKNDLHFASQ